jgi:hypothetical protein
MKTPMHTRVKISTHKPKTLNSINKNNYNARGGRKRNVENIGVKHKYSSTQKSIVEATKWGIH